MKRLCVVFFLTASCAFGAIYEPDPLDCRSKDWFHFGDDRPDVSLAGVE